MSALSHLDEAGRAHMVDVSAKPDTVREATARGRIRISCYKGTLDLGANLAMSLLDVSESGIRLLLKAPPGLRAVPFARDTAQRIAAVIAKLGPEHWLSAGDHPVVRRNEGPALELLPKPRFLGITGQTTTAPCAATWWRSRGAIGTAVRSPLPTDGVMR